MKLIGDVLKTNVPEFMQSFPNLMTFLEASGEFLDETRDGIINGLDYAQDYELSSAFGLENALESLGFQIPPNLKEEIKRVILRDAIEIFIRTGTEDSILWVLKILGVDPEIRYAWLASPAEVRRGYITDPLTGESRRYDVNKFAYTEFLYGSEEVTQDGVFFNGFKYTDPYLENPIEGLPIVGQRYNMIPDKVAVAKTPYVIVRIGGEGFNSITENYEDDRGFTESEIFRVVNDLIEYFLFQTARPTPVRIILVVSFQEVFDELVIDEEYVDDSPVHEPTPEQDNLTVDELDTRDGEVSIQEDVVVGTLGFWVGGEIPYEAQLSVLGDAFIVGETTTGTTKAEIPIEEWSQLNNIYYITETDNRILLRGLTEITFNAPAGTSIEVRGIFHKSNLNDYEIIETVAPNAPFNFINDNAQYHLVDLVYVTSVPDEFEATVTHNIPL